MFQADPRGIFALVAIAMCWGLALVLYRVGASGSVARKLALLLLVEGVTLISSTAFEFMLVSPGELHRLYPDFFGLTELVHLFGDCVVLALYPSFLAATLQTRLTRPFAGKQSRIAMALVSVALFFAVLFSPPPTGPLLLFFSLTLLFGFSLVASIQAWRTAVGIARTRAGIFALAFGIRDLCWGLVYAAVVREILTGALVVDTFLHTFGVYAMGTFFAVPLIAYGILRTQLFDIDLKIRWSIKQSILGAAIAIIMFIISEAAERLLTGEVGNFQSFLIAAVVVIFLTPLQRFADRVASAAMPNTKDTPEYAMARKKEVYEAAVSEALHEDGMSQRERNLLNVLRDSLGISLADAEALERELQERNVTLAQAA